MQVKHTSLKDKMNAFLGKQALIRFRFQDPYESWSRAYSGFRIIGKDGTTAMPALVQLMKSGERTQRRLVFSSLRLIEVDQKSLLPVVLPLLADSDACLRINAEVTLCQCCPEQGEKLRLFARYPHLRPVAVKTADAGTAVAN